MCCEGEKDGYCDLIAVISAMIYNFSWRETVRKGDRGMGLIVLIVIIVAIKYISKSKYDELDMEIRSRLGIRDWNDIQYYDDCESVKSRQALEKYDEIKFFKENKEMLEQASARLSKKEALSEAIKEITGDEAYKSRWGYQKLVKEKLSTAQKNAGAYRVAVDYVSSAGNHLGRRDLVIRRYDIDRLRKDPSLLMSKGEYNKFLKEQEKDALGQKQHKYYEKVNKIIDHANKNRDKLVIKGRQEKLDGLIAQLFDRTVNSIKKIKTSDSEEWDIIGGFIDNINGEVKKLIEENQKILNYYKSSDFKKIKETCDALMSTQREFNEYITEKVQTISKLFGSRVVRNETINDDEYEYIRPYKKTITPFTAEVSATVFASAENSPLEYVVKNFYPNKALYPEQIRKLQQLLEELETLKDAKQIIENYKKDYQQYLGDVPDFIMKNDEAGFYSRLGFANVDESVLTVEYKFSYTSNGGLAQRSFTVPMTEETVVELIQTLQSKLTASAFAKEQRTLMTRKLREKIKNRDNFTCCNCGNSTHVEPNLLLEIDHIIPVAKGGCTVEENLQTLCWKCNRAKSDKITA